VRVAGARGRESGTQRRFELFRNSSTSRGVAVRPHAAPLAADRGLPSRTKVPALDPAHLFAIHSFSALINAELRAHFLVLGRRQVEGQGELDLKPSCDRIESREMPSTVAPSAPVLVVEVAGTAAASVVQPGVLSFG